MIDRRDAASNDLHQAVEAAERAGSIVTEHVRSIVDAAETRAAEIERSAQRDAAEMRSQAHEAARRVLERIDTLEGHLGTLVNGLRREADNLSGDVNRRA